MLICQITVECSLCRRWCEKHSHIMSAKELATLSSPNLIPLPISFSTRPCAFSLIMLIFKVALAILSLPVLTSASTSADAQSCRQASHLVSCQTKVKVDPSSYATCCYNGALQKGYKESGLVLATQFYDTDPSIGPKDSTTIHGKWKNNQKPYYRESSLIMIF